MATDVVVIIVRALILLRIRRLVPRVAAVSEPFSHLWRRAAVREGRVNASGNIVPRFARLWYKAEQRWGGGARDGSELFCLVFSQAEKPAIARSIAPAAARGGRLTFLKNHQHIWKNFFCFRLTKWEVLRKTVVEWRAFCYLGGDNQLSCCYYFLTTGSCKI